MSELAELHELIPIKINGDVRVNKNNCITASNVNRQLINFKKLPNNSIGNVKLKEFKDKNEYKQTSGVQLRSYNKWNSGKIH